VLLAQTLRSPVEGFKHLKRGRGRMPLEHLCTVRALHASRDAAGIPDNSSRPRLPVLLKKEAYRGLKGRRNA